MANWGAAFETLGKGLQLFAGQRLEREAREIEALRQEAIDKVRREHDVTMAGRREKHDMDLFDRRETAEEDRFKRENDAANERDRANRGHQERLLDKRSVADALEQANRDYTTRLVSLQRTRQELVTEKAKLSAQGFSDPEGMKAFDQLLDELEDQEKIAQQSYILTTRRIQSGGYGKTETVSAADVAKLIGEKPANTDSVAANPDTAPRPSVEQTPAVSGGAASGTPVSNTGAPAEPELFPGAPQRPPGEVTSMSELVARQQAAVRQHDAKLPSIGDVLERARQVLAESSARNKQEISDRQRRENYWRDQAIPVQ